MRHTLLVRFAMVIFLTPILYGCGDDENPLTDESSISGTYRLVSLVDKLGGMTDTPGLTIMAGVQTAMQVDVNGTPTDFTVVFDGTWTFTDDRYTMSMTITFSIPVFGTESETDVDSGTYSIQGSTITINSDDPETPSDTATFSKNGDRITIENAEMKVVLEKQ